jgi:aminoglycoside phosphotransferase (APT) family kinase protein
MIADLVFAATGHEPTQIERSGSGLTHDVYDVGFRNRPAVVLRVAGPGQGQDMIDAARLIRKLRSLGVPLAPIFADRSKAEIPHLLLMPLPGSDLGDVADRLSDASLAFIAGRVQAAQAVVAQLPTAGRFGYSAAPEAAPHTTWGAVIDEKLDRARARIGAAGVFDPALADGVAELARALRAALDGFPAIAFLPDATDKNVIVTEHGGFSGIVDVDNLCFGDPRFAAALTLAGMTAFGGPARCSGFISPCFCWISWASKARRAMATNRRATRSRAGGWRNCWARRLRRRERGCEFSDIVWQATRDNMDRRSTK